MTNYRAQGYILIEGTGEEASYDIDIDWDTRFNPRPPTEIDVLNYMLDVGIIQIISSEIEEQ